LEFVVHDIAIPEFPPALSQFCFWFVSVGTLTPVLFVCFVMVVVSANAKRPFPIAIVLTANTVAIAAIAISDVFRPIIKFTCRSAVMLYLQCLTSSANIMALLLDV
jgi:hypothetical protein